MDKLLHGDSLTELAKLEDESVCAIPGCDNTFRRSPSQIKGRNQFCSRKHKEKGMTLGLCNPSRLGTGYGVEDILRRRKFYKYRQFDRSHGFVEMDMGVREFCKRVSAPCEYCGSTKDVGLDRIDNTKGHHESNTVVCCALCNMTRGNRFTVEQMRKLGEVIRTFHHE